jgi:pimeloyl-ACP methyl ester carboxylesterase
MLPDSVRDPARWPAGYRMEEQWYRAADGTKLHGVAFRRDGARAAVLFFGGNAFTIRNSGLRRARALGGVGVDSYFADYRGYGQSEGVPTIDVLKADALEVYDSLIASGKVRSEVLIVHGHSMGTFVATYLATQRPVAGLVLESPVTNVDEWVERSTPGFVDLLFNVRADAEARKESNVERIRQVPVPLLVIVGSKDGTTPPDMAQRVFDAATLPAERKQLRVLKGSGHNDVTANPEFRAAYEQFLAMVLLSAAKR